VDVVNDATEHARESKLNSSVAILVAMTAVMMALCNIKDGNIVQAMTQAQAHGVDAWSYYQSKSTKQHIAENMVETIEMQALVVPNATPAVRTALQQRIVKYRGQARTYAAEKDSIRKVAEGFAAEYDRLNVHDDQFDMADACFSIAIALCGITALTQRRWLWFMAFAAVVFGAIAGLSGFLGWSFHPEWVAKWLG
jgi:hypothetical protein